MIPVKIAQVSFSNMGFVALLRSAKDPRTLPIFIGAPEAQAIAFFLDHVEVPRPLTHDLFKTVLDNLECRMKRVEINAINDNTFYAQLFLEYNGIESVIDSRPSDAMALAVRCSAPIYVADDVMDSAGVIIKDETGGSPLTGEAANKKPLSAVESLKQQIAKAVEAERFEDAARLRDELKKLTHAN